MAGSNETLNSGEARVGVVVRKDERAASARYLQRIVTIFWGYCFVCCCGCCVLKILYYFIYVRYNDRSYF